MTSTVEERTDSLTTERQRRDSTSKRRRSSRESDASVGTGALLWFERAIFFAVLAVIALSAIPYGTVERWSEAALEVLIFSLAALWVIEGLLRGEWKLRGLGLLAPLLAIIAYAYIQTIPLRSNPANGWPTISADAFGTRLVVLKLLALAVAGALLLRFTTSMRRLRALIYMVLITAVASAIFGIVRETTQHETIGFLLPQLRPRVGYGQFINRNHFAYLMEMALGLALGLALGRNKSSERLIYIAAALPVWLALVLANSRGGILSMLSQLLFLLLMYGIVTPRRERKESKDGAAATIRKFLRKRAVRVALVAGILGAMIYGVLWIGGDPLTRRLETLQSEVTSEDADVGEGARRMQIWQATWKMFKQHPLTGIGFGSYWVAITEFYDVPGEKRPYEAHNDYLELLVSGGIIGVALGIWFAFVLVKRVRKVLRVKNSFRREACLGALTGLFGVAVHSLVDFGLQINANALICVALVVIATVELKGEEAPIALPDDTHRRRRRTASRHESELKPN